MRLASLRVRIGFWYALFTLSCLAVFGVFLSLYLGKALEASRAPTMMRRANRVTAFVNLEHHQNPSLTLDAILRNFVAASPESDELVVSSADGASLLFAGGGHLQLEKQGVCATLPCFSEFRLRGQHYRMYTDRAVLAGVPVLVTLAGSIDEHYRILRTVRSSYVLFVPFLLLASLTGGYVLSGRALLPVGRMTAIASQLSLTDLQGRVPVPVTGDELQILAEAWNNMLARLQVSVEKNAQFTSDASHDLRTSIAVMLASTELALRSPRTREQYESTLRTLASECGHTLHILQDLLASARSGFEQHQLQQEKIDLSAMVRQRCDLFSAKAEARDQSLNLELESDGWMLGDRSLLHRLVGILVDNALKYTPAGGSIVVATRSTRTQLFLTVADTGPGIANENLARIFGRRFRDSSSQLSEPGSGLGLSIARWIAEAHNATVQVRSEVGAGSTFEVTFQRPESHL